MEGYVPPELITQDQFAVVWAVLCGGWVVVSLVWAGLAWGRSGRVGAAGPRALAAALGPLGWALWSLYRARIAYDPGTGIAGLHLVSVFLTNVLLFLVVGVLAGIVWGRIARRSAADSSQQS